MNTTIDDKSPLEAYLEKSGQSMQELFAGASQVGMSHILDELIPKALKEDKKIYWIVDDEKLGTGEYILE